MKCASFSYRRTAAVAVTWFLTGATIVLPYASQAAFVISAQRSCSGSGVYAFHFSTYAVMPDFDVRVSSYALMPDLKLQVVSSPRQADLILADDLSDWSMRVCKSTSPFGVTTIKASSHSVMPDISVQLSRSVFMPDYKIFVASDILSATEAAALFAVIWESNRQ